MVEGFFITFIHRLQLQAFFFIMKEISIKGEIIMAKTVPVYARIDSELKENAENILNQLGVSPSSLIQMLYSQVILQKRIPFEAKLPDRKIVDISDMTRDEIDLELMKGLKSLQTQKTLTSDEVKEKLIKELGL